LKLSATEVEKRSTRRISKRMQTWAVMPYAAKWHMAGVCLDRSFSGAKLSNILDKLFDLAVVELRAVCRHAEGKPVKMSHKVKAPLLHQKPWGIESG
jgi:hypothetical protein